MRRLVSFVLTIALASCSGGSLVPQRIPSASLRDAGATGKVSATILIPKAPAGLRPRYVSPSSKGARFQLVGASTVKKVAGLTATSPGCTKGTKGVTCVLTLTAPACSSEKPCYTGELDLYDSVACNKTGTCGIPAGAKLLSADRGFSVVVTAGQTTALDLVLGGVPKSVAIVPGAGTSLAGNSAKGFTAPKCLTSHQPVKLFGEDAAGNLIVGPGAPQSPALISSDKTHLAVATPGPNALPNAFALVPPKTLKAATIPIAKSVVHLTASVTPLASTGSTKPVSSQIDVTFDDEVCGVVTEFSQGITSGSHPNGITSGPDGNLWFTEQKDRVAKITTSGTVTEYSSGITAGSQPNGIVAGPDGNLWFGEDGYSYPNFFGQVAKVTTDGTVTEYSQGISQTVMGITAGPDGNLWFTESNGLHQQGYVGKITTDGTVTEYSTGISGAPLEIAAGSDGNLWFSECTGIIGKITTGGSVTEYSAGFPSGALTWGITSGPDGNLWFTDLHSQAVGKITTGGAVTEYPTGYSGSNISGIRYGITAGPDGNVWFTLNYADAIGRITTAGAVTIKSIGPASSSSLQPQYITVGPDGNLWFTEFAAGRVARIQ